MRIRLEDESGDAVFWYSTNAGMANLPSAGERMRLGAEDEFGEPILVALEVYRRIIVCGNAETLGSPNVILVVGHPSRSKPNSNVIDQEE